MNLDLSDEEGKALAAELDAIVRNDRYPLSPRIQLLKAILGQLRPEPVREPLPEPKRYAPPRATAARRRRTSLALKSQPGPLMTESNHDAALMNSPLRRRGS